MRASRPTAALAAPCAALAQRLQLGVRGWSQHERALRSTSRSTTAWPSVRPRRGRCPRRARPAAPASAPRAARIAIRRRTCAEKVERLSAIDWSSPMSASTRSKTGSRARAAGTRRPHWCSIASRPSVLSATVLPPVLGPDTTSARTPSSGRSIGTAEAGSSSGWRAARSSTSPPARPGSRPRPATARPRQRQVEPGERGREVVERRALVADQARQRPQDPLLLLGLLGGQLAGPVVRLHQLHRLDEEGLARARAVVDDPGDGRRDDAFTASTGRPPRSVVNDSWRWERRRAASAAAGPTRRAVPPPGGGARTRAPARPCRAARPAGRERARAPPRRAGRRRRPAPRPPRPGAAPRGRAATASRASSQTRTVARTAASASASSAASRAAAAVDGRRSEAPPGPPMPRARSAGAPPRSPPGATPRAPGRATGRARAPGPRPPANDVSPASRSRTAGSSSSSALLRVHATGRVAPDRRHGLGLRSGSGGGRPVTPGASARRRAAPAAAPTTPARAPGRCRRSGSPAAPRGCPGWSPRPARRGGSRTGSAGPCSGG